MNLKIMKCGYLLESNYFKCSFLISSTFPTVSCMAGFELKDDKECQMCQQGYYKHISGNSTCSKCPLSNATTAGRGATSKKDCNLGRHIFLQVIFTNI